MSQRPYKDFYVATTGELASTGGTQDLAVGQIGFFSGKNWQVTTAPTFQTCKTLVVAQGTPDLSGFPEGAGIPNTSFKVTIDPLHGKIFDWYVKKSQRPQNMIVRLGFDGVDTTKTLSANYGETKQIYLKLSGQPINNFYPDVPAGLKIPILIQMPCADECADSCASQVPCSTIGDLIVDAVNNYKIIGGQPLSKYVRATKIVQCGTPSGQVTSCFEKYEIDLCDDGSPNALAKVQAQYPGKTISRVKRVDAISTYRFEQPCGGSAPEAFVANGNNVVPNCSTCPTGYTLQDTLYVYEIKVADAGDGTALAAVETAYASGDDAVVRILYENGVSTYLLYATTFPRTQQTLVGFLQSYFGYVGVARAVCVGDADETTAWTKIEEGEKAAKYWKLSLKLDPCSADGEEGCSAATLLAQLQEAYANIGTVTLTDTNCTFCVAEFKLQTFSDNILYPSCNGEDYKWSLPPAFENQNWIEVVEGGYPGTDCACGVQFESAFYDPKRDACTFEGVPYFSDPLYIEVSQHDPSSLASPCETDWPVTTVQNIKFPSGYGQLVSDFERKSKYYRNVFYNVDPVVRKYRGYQWNTDFEGYYDEYVLVFQNPVPEYGVNSTTRTETFEVHWFFPEGNGKSFETAINGYLASANINIDLKVIESA